MRFLIFLLCTLPFFAVGQEKPIIMPEDIAPSTVGIRCYCKPGLINQSRSRGLEISYKFLGPSRFKGEGETLSAPFTERRYLQSMRIKLKVPIINKSNFKLLAGYNYLPEWAQMNQLGVDYTQELGHLDGLLLKSNAFSLIAVKPINENIYTTFKVKVGSNGDYDGWMNWERRYGVFNAIGAVGFKKRDDLEWGVGVSFSKSFRRTIAIPFVLFNRYFNENWGLETILPARILVRHNVNPRTIVLSGVEYNSRSFSITVDDPLTNQQPIYHLNHSEIEGLFRVERQIVPWVWFNFDVGYQLNFSTDFAAKNSDVADSFMVDPKDTIFFRFGVFISPPDSMMK